MHRASEAGGFGKGVGTPGGLGPPRGAANQRRFSDVFSDAFLERFGVDFGTHFGAVWHQNASKTRSKIDAKIDAEKVMENDAKKVEK